MWILYTFIGSKDEIDGEPWLENITFLHQRPTPSSKSHEKYEINSQSTKWDYG